MFQYGRSIGQFLRELVCALVGHDAVTLNYDPFDGGTAYCPRCKHLIPLHWSGQEGSHENA